MTFLPAFSGHLTLRAPCIGLALLLCFGCGHAQTKPALTTSTPVKTCLKAQQLKAEDLHGQWAVQFTNPARGLPAQATLTLGVHADYADSLSGTLLRDLSAAPGGKVPGHSPRAQVAGDLENGLLMLDESSNGTNLTASWDGKVVDGSCGKIIQGVWKDLSSDAPADAADVPFRMRQTSAW